MGTTMNGDVTLTPREIAMAAHVGVMRNITALSAKLIPANGFNKEHAWNEHIEGACGEVAFAKLVNRYWMPSVNTFRAADIGLDIQVRTRSRHDYELIVRPSDNPEHVFVLVTGRSPNFRIRGYVFGREARRDEWFRDHGGRPPAWFIPHDELRPWEDLRMHCELPQQHDEMPFRRELEVGG
jgi:hypothetical protein